MKSPNLWEKFDPIAYIKDNYSYIHDEDRRIIEILVRFYKTLPKLNKSVEIGCGPNIYPLIIALPLVKQIDIVEYSSQNISYLKNQLLKLGKNWFLFWDLMKNLDQTRKDIDVEKSIKEKIKINHGSIYSLPKNGYDLSSMFFCAESITKSKKKFALLCNKFIESVKPNGYLVAAFMENSKGYKIGKIDFPAVSINSDDLAKTFENKVNKLKIYRVPKAKKVLRPGYTGMLVLTGRRK